MNKRYYELDEQTKVRYFFISFKKGVEKMFQDKKKLLFLVGYIFFCIILWKAFFPYFTAHFPEKANGILYRLIVIAFPFALYGGIIGLIMLYGRPIGANKINSNLWEIGLVNHSGGSPLLIDEYIDKENSKITILEFLANNVPCIRWEAEKEKIETALDCNVIRFEEGTTKKIILLYTAKTHSMPTLIHWDNSFLLPNDFELVLGEGYKGQEKINLNITPHVLIGGATGSGKSILMKLLLLQSIQKGADVYIADFKGGIDFGLWWHKHSTFITTETETIKYLDILVSEIEIRKALFLETGSKNISEYNNNTGDTLKRILFACDEIAELLDKTGASKERKDSIYQIEYLLATIARLGRAYGIHLILVTQRPDANILSGQIKNNLNIRICGRADNVLSQIILDDTSASKEIENYAQGRFLNQDGTVFQSHLVDEQNLPDLKN